MSQAYESRKNPGSLRLKGSLALGLSTLALTPVQLLAAEATSPDVQQLSRIKVEEEAIDPNPDAQPGVPYKARTSGDERHSRPLAETPQTISVITKAAIDESGYTDLAQVLDAQPGITLGTGENGNAFGDRYVIRGQEARSDVFVDGLRDPGMTTRESFAIEQLEISKGPNSSFAGRGTSGGAINAITKQATTADDFTRLATGFGTGRHTRLTADINHSFGAQFAVRANALYGYEEVPDREPASRERKGLALSGLYSPTERLNVVVDYYGLRARDNPDLGSYLEGTVPDRVPAADVPVYVQKQDFEDSDVNAVTARFDYAPGGSLRIVSRTRYATSDNGYVVTGARSATTGANNPGGSYATVTLSTHQGWQEVEYFATQNNLLLDTQLFGRDHDFVFGLEYTDHSALNGIYQVSNSGQNCITGTGTTLNAWCAVGSNGQPVNGLNTLMNRRISRGNWDIDWHVATTSGVIMDTIDLAEAWTLFAGARLDRFDFDLGIQNTTTLVQTRYQYADTLWNGHLGLTRKLGKGGMVYATVASASDINGGESDVGTSSGYGGTVIYNGEVAGANPENSINLELGTKWNLLGERLLLTAAAFQSTKSGVMEGADYSSVGTFNTGKNRVRGVEFGAAGNLTEALTGQLGLTLMQSRVLRSATAANVGKVLSNFADRSLSAQLKYAFTDDIAAGGAVKYESRKYGGQPDTAAVYGSDGQYSQPVPSYAVLDLFATWQINKNLGLRLNIGNVTDKDFYTAVYRSGSFLYKGDARNYRLTFNYEL
jgi:catecholate siderophore receptor